MTIRDTKQEAIAYDTRQTQHHYSALWSMRADVWFYNTMRGFLVDCSMSSSELKHGLLTVEGSVCG